MARSKIETGITSDFNLRSEDRSRGSERGQRLLTMMAAGFVLLALCLMFVDVRRLDHLAPRHESPYRQMLRPVKMVTRVAAR